MVAGEAPPSEPELDEGFRGVEGADGGRESFRHESGRWALLRTEVRAPGYVSFDPWAVIWVACGVRDGFGFRR
jgi:hypothetical protein